MCQVAFNGVKGGFIDKKIFSSSFMGVGVQGLYTLLWVLKYEEKYGVLMAF